MHKEITTVIWALSTPFQTNLDIALNPLVVGMWVGACVCVGARVYAREACVGRRGVGGWECACSA